MENKKYDYYEAVKNSIKDVLPDYEKLGGGVSDKDEYRENLYDNLWIDNHVTGNGSGSYTFNRELAKEYVSQNLDLAVEAYSEFDQKAQFGDDIANGDYEKIDVTIRCYLLGQVLDEVIEESSEAEAKEKSEISSKHKSDDLEI